MNVSTSSNIRLRFFNAFILLQICIYGFLLIFSELRGDADEQFEVDTGHGAREHRKVVLVEEIIDCKFQLNVHRFEKQVFLQGDVAHEIFGQVSCQRVVVA